MVVTTEGTTMKTYLVLLQGRRSGVVPVYVGAGRDAAFREARLYHERMRRGESVQTVLDEDGLRWLRRNARDDPFDVLVVTFAGGRPAAWEKLGAPEGGTVLPFEPP
jgi:hypothetical protein